jgi:hypothetical protein
VIVNALEGEEKKGESSRGERQTKSKSEYVQKEK